jgi:phage terminase large subunit-like protein
LSLAGAIMMRAQEWLQGTDARWNEKKKTFYFPSGATLSFAYLAKERDKYRYQSTAFHFIGFDELTQFTLSQYSYMFSRLRRPTEGIGSNIPLRMRAATNPGDEGHGWVYARFPIGRDAEGDVTGRRFIPATMRDNPYIDQEEYLKSLAELDDVTRKQLELGLWVTDPLGKPFRRGWWRGRNRYALPADQRVLQTFARIISLDTALKDKETNAYTAWTIFDIRPDYRLRLRHAGRARLTFPDLADQITRLEREWNHDGKLIGIVIEDKASGTSALQTLAFDDFGRLLVAFTPSGDKLQRWRQAALWASRGAIEHPHPDESLPWLGEFEQEIFSVPDTEFKDYADSYAQGIIYLENYAATWWAAQQSKEKEKKVA